MSDAPKYEVGQIVVVKSIKKEPPVRLLARELFDGEWGYKVDRKNWFSEHMLRPLTDLELGPRAAP